MQMNLTTLREIQEIALAHSNRYSETLSVLGDLASNQAITWEEVEHIREAVNPHLEAVNAVHKAAKHAISYMTYENSIKLPFGPGVTPITADEEALLSKAYNDYFNI